MTPLTKPMVDALKRLESAYVWIDGRSARALERRGFVRFLGRFDDELLGGFESWTITDAGRSALAESITCGIPK